VAVVVAVVVAATMSLQDQDEKMLVAADPAG
jgi:hypothetical protein